MSALPLHIARLSLPQLQTAFLAEQDRIVTHAKLSFRHIPCQQQRDDRVAEVVALCWKWFCNLARRGKDARTFISTLATYAVRAVRSGRRLCGQLKAKDVLSERAQHKHGFGVESLPISSRQSFERRHAEVGGQREVDVFEERLHDNTQTPVPDQVAFRCDFPTWVRTRTRRDRRLIRDMARNERTLALAKKYQLSPARVSQLRREFHDDWEQFTADPVEASGAPNMARA